VRCAMSTLPSHAPSMHTKPLRWPPEFAPMICGLGIRGPQP
jgi:hypothetical protein